MNKIIEEQIRRTKHELNQESRRLARLKNAKLIMKAVNAKSVLIGLLPAVRQLKALHRRLRR